MVYNLSVDEDETYVVQGCVVVHNCKKGETWGFEDLLTGAYDGDDRSVTGWWAQCARECPEGKVPLLVFARNLMPAMIAFPKEVMLGEDPRVRPKGRILGRRFVVNGVFDRQLAITTLDNFCERYELVRRK